MKQLLFLAFLVLASCGCSSKVNSTSTTDSLNDDKKQSETKPTPESEAKVKIALIFINEYSEKSYSTPEMKEWLDANDTITSSFVADWNRIMDEAYKEEPELGLGFDPILCAQDIPYNGYELDYFDAENNYCFLKEKGTEQFKTVVRVVEENGRWLIDGAGIVNIAEGVLVED